MNEGNEKIGFSFSVTTLLSFLKAETDSTLLLLDSQHLEVCICSVNTYSWCDWKAGILWQSQPAEMNNDDVR